MRPGNTGFMGRYWTAGTVVGDLCFKGIKWFWRLVPFNSRLVPIGVKFLMNGLFDQTTLNGFSLQFNGIPSQNNDKHPSQMFDWCSDCKYGYVYATDWTGLGETWTLLCLRDLYKQIMALRRRIIKVCDFDPTSTFTITDNCVGSWTPRTFPELFFLEEQTTSHHFPVHFGLV